VGRKWFWNSYNAIQADVPYGSVWDEQKRTDDELAQDGIEPEGPINTAGGGYAFIAKVWNRPELHGHGDDLHTEDARANARFIEHAPADIDWLLAEVDRLRAKTGEL
jgi:hypothetical protein